ncbi:MAG: hypothetical protein WBN36_19260, partial [Gammaproteobacteria bacterium]
LIKLLFLLDLGCAVRTEKDCRFMVRTAHPTIISIHRQSRNLAVRLIHETHPFGANAIFGS